jgi:phosphonate transport system permease protein
MEYQQVSALLLVVLVVVTALDSMSNALRHLMVQ